MSDAHDLVDGRFRLQRLLVKTNLSQVWFARDVRFGRRVVIKAAQHSSASATSELGVLQSLPPHPNIVQLLHSFQTRPGNGHSPQLLCLVLERLGPSLSSLTRQATEPGSDAGRGASPLPLYEVKRMAQQVLAGLSHMHRHGVVHRDVTAGNVCMVALPAAARGPRPWPQGAAAWKLLDFGNACQPQPQPWAAQLAPDAARPLHDGGHGLHGLDYHESEPKPRLQEAHPWMHRSKGHRQSLVQPAGQLGCRLIHMGQEEEEEEEEEEGQEEEGQEVLVTPAYAGPEEWLGLLPPTFQTPQHTAIVPTTCSCAHLPSTYHNPRSHTKKCGGLHGGSGSRDHRRCDQAEQGSGRGWGAEQGGHRLPANALHSCGLPWACPGNDIWGLACLVYEAATGCQLLSPLRVRNRLAAAAAAAASDCEGEGTSGSNEHDGTPAFSPWARAGERGGGWWAKPGQGVRQQLGRSRLEEIEDEELLLWQMSRVLGPILPEVRFEHPGCCP
ncbi:kinase-like domain-containing protein [Haematococcus lacustris]